MSWPHVILLFQSCDIETSILILVQSIKSLMALNHHLTSPFRALISSSTLLVRNSFLLPPAECAEWWEDSEQHSFLSISNKTCTFIHSARCLFCQLREQHWNTFVCFSLRATMLVILSWWLVVPLRSLIMVPEIWNLRPFRLWTRAFPILSVSPATRGSTLTITLVVHCASLRPGPPPRPSTSLWTCLHFPSRAPTTSSGSVVWKVSPYSKWCIWYNHTDLVQ